MKTVLTPAKQLTCQVAHAVPMAAADALKASANRPRRPAFIEQLMPFGAAAKRIFVSANGLAAYYVSTGAVGCFD